MDIIYSLHFTDDTTKIQRRYEHQEGAPWMLVNWITYLRLELKHESKSNSQFFVFPLLSADLLDSIKYCL